MARAAIIEGKVIVDAKEVDDLEHLALEEGQEAMWFDDAQKKNYKLGDALRVPDPPKATKPTKEETLEKLRAFVEANPDVKSLLKVE